MANLAIEQAWSDLEAALAEKIPLVANHLDLGATSEEFAALEAVLGFPCPEDLRSFYQRHNGHSALEEIDYGFSVRSPLYPSLKDYLYTDYFLFSLVFMPVYKPDNEDADIWDFAITDFIAHRELPLYTESPHYLETFDFVGPVKQQLWCDRWVPIAHSGDGDVVCVDYDPEVGGRPGQVIYCKYSENFIQVIADSLAGFLHLQAEDLRLGLIQVKINPGSPNL